MSDATMTRRLGWVQRMVTTGRMIWLCFVFVASGIGTGVGFLLGEGAARASFEARVQSHEARLDKVERAIQEGADRTNIVIAEIREVKGSMSAVLTLLQAMRRQP